MKFPVGSILHKLPKDLPDEPRAMTEPSSCVIHAVERATIGFADTVVISGTGSIGLCMLQVASLCPETPKKRNTLPSLQGNSAKEKCGSIICYFYPSATK
jgi:L-iditol 2-dehydrogenase